MQYIIPTYPIRIVEENDPVRMTDNNGSITQYPGNFPKDEIPGLIACGEPAPVPATIEAPASHWRHSWTLDETRHPVGQWTKIADDLTLAAVVADTVTAIEDHAAALRDEATAGISPAEMSAWPLKTMQATEYQASNDVSAVPLLAIEAASRKTQVSDIAARVLANAQRLMPLEGAIAGTAGFHKDAVRALTAIEDVLAYDWSTGWPSELNPPLDR
jgi:hypothetical protein